MPAPPRLRFVAALIAALAAAPALAQPAADATACRERAEAALADDPRAEEPAVTRALRDALALCERALGADDLLVATLVEELAHVSLDAGRNDEAGQLLRRALATRERVEGPDDPDVGATAASLAEVLWQRAHHSAETEALLRRALAIAEARVETADDAARPLARDVATRRALQLTRFLLDQWRAEDAALAIAAADEDAPPLDAGHFHNGRAEIALARGELCLAADEYAHAAEEYRYAFFADDTHSDRRWLNAWVENAPTLLTRVGRRDQAGVHLSRMIASRIAINRTDLLTGRAQGAVEALPTTPSEGPRC